MAPVYIKSLVYLASLGGLGYALLLLTEPKVEQTTKELSSIYSKQKPEELRKKELILTKLREATHSEPIYWQNKSKKD